MTHILELTPDMERALERTAARHGVAPDEFVLEVVTREVQRDEIAALYGDSLASNGELTASTRHQEDLHEYSAEELAAMEAGEFERPLH